MRGVQAFVAQPRREPHNSVRVLFLHRIFVAAPDPLFDAEVLVEPESGLVAAPHFRSASTRCFPSRL